MSDIRLKMKPFLNRRIEVRGRFAEFRDDEKGIRVGISYPETGGELLSDFAWVIDCLSWVKHKGKVGALVQFTAVVAEFIDKKNQGVPNYCLRTPYELAIQDEPVAMPIPNPPEVAPPPGGEDEKQPPFSTLPDPLKIFRQVRTFAKGCGGYEQAIAFVTAFRQITVPPDQLVDWLTAMKDE